MVNGILEKSPYGIKGKSVRGQPMVVKTEIISLSKSEIICFERIYSEIYFGESTINSRQSEVKNTCTTLQNIQKSMYNTTKLTTNHHIQYFETSRTTR